MIKYSIAKDFTQTPGLRYRYQSPFSGEQFREEVLIPLGQKAEKGEIVIIDMDGTYGYPLSFLDESFGVWIRSFASKENPGEPILLPFRLIFFSRDQPELDERIYDIVQEGLN